MNHAPAPLSEERLAEIANALFRRQYGRAEADETAAAYERDVPPLLAELDRTRAEVASARVEHGKLRNRMAGFSYEADAWQARAEAAESALPASYYAGHPLAERVRLMSEHWNHATQVAEQEQDRAEAAEAEAARLRTQVAQELGLLLDLTGAVTDGELMDHALAACQRLGLTPIYPPGPDA